MYLYLYLYHLLKYPLHTLEEAATALPRYTSCDATLFQPLKSTAHHRPHVDHSDDDEHDDDDDEDEDDVYIMMKCMFVCHEKSSLPPGCLL